MREPDGILILTEGELRGCVGLDDEALAAIEGAFTRLARGEATVPRSWPSRCPSAAARWT